MRNSLRRTLTPGAIALLTLSVISPAAGVLLGGNEATILAGDGLLAALALGGLMVLSSSVIQAELGSAFPTAGGDYKMTAQALGRTTGAVVLYFTLAMVAGFLAISAQSAAAYLGEALVVSVPPGAGAIVLLLNCALALARVNITAAFAAVIVAAEFALLIVLAASGVAHPERALSDIASLPSRGSASGFMTAIVVTYWAMIGAGQAIYFSEEASKREKVGAVVAIVALLVVIAESALVVGLALSAPIGDGFLSELSARGGGQATLIAIGLGVAFWAANLTAIVCYARMLFSAGRDNLGPERLSAVSRRTGAPWLAVVALASLAAAASLAEASMLIAISGWLSLGVGVILALALVSARLRGLSGRPGAFRSPFFPLPSIVVVAGAVCIALVTWRSSSKSGLALGLAIGLAATAMAVAWIQSALKTNRRAIREKT